MGPVQGRAHWRAVWSLAFGTAALTGSEILPAGLLSPIARDLAVGDAVAGQAVTAAAAAAVISSLLTSVLAGRVDRRAVLLAIFGLQAASNVVVALAPDFPTVILGRILLGLSLGGFWALSTSLAIALVPESRVPHAISVIFGGVAVATVVAPPLGSVAATVVGWRGVFAAVGALSLAVLAGQALWLPAMRPPKAVLPSSIAAAARSGTIVAGLAGVAASFAGNLCVFTYIRPFLEGDVGLSDRAVSGAFALFAAGTSLGAVAAGFVLSRSVRGTLAAAAATVAAAGALLVSALVSAFVSSLGAQAAAFAYMLVLGLGFGLIPVGWSTWLSRVASGDPESAGALLVATIQTSIAGGAALGGLAFDARGSAGSILLGSLLLFAAAAITLVWIKPERAPRRGPTSPGPI